MNSIITWDNQGGDPNIGAFPLASLKIVDEEGQIWNRSTTPQTRVYTANADFDGLSTEGVGDGQERLFVLETFDANGEPSGADGGGFVPEFGLSPIRGNLGNTEKALEYKRRLDDDI